MGGFKLSKYKMELINSHVCCKCRSNNITKRFIEPEETEDYHMHYDTLKCVNCGYWDFPSAFDITIFKSDKSEVCPSCGAVGKVELNFYDWYSGDIGLECTKCKNVDNISKFVGEERWNQFIKECDEKEKRYREKLAKYTEENDF